MIVKCARTGIEFEANSKRQKNHPEISAALAEASKDKYNSGAYRIACEACEAIKEDGDYTIDEAVQFIRQSVSEGAQAKISRVAADRKERREHSAERERVNGILRTNGYTWSKEDEESMDIFGATAFESMYGSGMSVAWTLWSPDGRIVSVRQALAEIEEKNNDNIH